MLKPFFVATPKLNSGLFGGTTTAPGENGTPTANASTTNATGSIFGSGPFGKPATTTSTTTAPAATGLSFSLGGNKDSAAPTSKS